MNTIELMQRVTEKTGAKTPYQLAQILEIPNARIYDYVAGKRNPDVYGCTRIAIALEMEPIEIIAEIEAETEKNEQRKEFWKSFKLHAGKTAMIAIALSFIPFSNPVQADGLSIGNLSDSPIMRSCGDYFNVDLKTEIPTAATWS